MSQFFAVKVKKNTVLLELRINDIPLVLESEQQDMDTNEIINLWIKPGDNKLTIYLNWPAAISYQPGLGECRIQVLQLEEGQTESTNAPLVDFIWPLPGQVPVQEESTDPATSEYYPYEETMGFHVHPMMAPPSRLWRDATPIVWGDNDKQIIITILTTLHRLLNQKDVNTITKLLDFKAIDACGTHYIPPDEARESQKEFLEMLFSIEAWGMEDLITENLEFHLLTDHRILWVSGNGMVPALRSNNDSGFRFLLPVYFALIDDQWLIVR